MSQETDIAEEEIHTQDDQLIARIKEIMDNQISDDAPNDKEDTPKNEEDDAPVKVNTKRNEAFDQSQVTQASLYAWSMLTPELGTVEVTDVEKSAYLKAVLNDVPVVLDIDLAMAGKSIDSLPVTIRLRTLNNYEMDVVFMSLEKDREAGLISGHHQLATRIQQYAIAMQLQKVGQTTVKNLSFPEPGDMDTDVEVLRKFLHDFVGRMSWPRYQAVLMALRVFETKLKICNDAALNGNFWKPPGVAS